MSTRWQDFGQTFALVVFATVNALNALSAQPGEALSAQQQARSALGLQSAASDVKSILLQGVTREGFNAVTGELSRVRPFEIRMLFPDHYLRIDQIQDSVATVGFQGDRVINEWVALSPGSEAHAVDNPNQLQQLRGVFARLALGMLAEPQTALRLRAKGLVNVGDERRIEYEGSDGMLATLVVDRQSAIPTRVEYDAHIRFPSKLSPEARRYGVPPLAPPQPARIDLQFSDRRMISAISLPHLIVRSSRGTVFEEMRVQRVVLNSLTANTFRTSGGREEAQQARLIRPSGPLPAPRPPIR